MTKSLTTRPSPSTTRAVGILNFLAEHPQQAFKLSELQRVLKLSRTTCHSILLALLEAGYVHRGSDKSYSLGPALIEVGRAAGNALSPLQVAQPEMRRLADTYDVICSAVFMEGREMVVRDRAASVSHLGFSAPRGIRLPMGGSAAAAIQFAWSRPAEFDAWLGELDSPPTPAERAEMARVVGFVREHRFALGFVDGGAEEGAEPTPRSSHRYATSMAAEAYRVAVLQAWVFDARARVAFALTLTGMRDPLAADEVLRRGIDLRGACDGVTAAIGGRWPLQSELGVSPTA